MKNVLISMPTNDFVMKLLLTGSMIEVISPASLRKKMKIRISEMYELIKTTEQHVRLGNAVICAAITLRIW